MDVGDAFSRSDGRGHFFPFFSRAPAGAAAFTLMELLITMAVAALLATVAVPSMRTLYLDQRMTAQVNALITHLDLARSEAVTRNRQVVICRSADRRACDRRGGWHEGWIMFVDKDRNEKRGAGESVLRRRGALPPGLSLHYAGFPSSRYVTFEPTGRSNANGTFVFCDGRGAAAAKAVVLARTGRPRLTRRRPDGAPLVC